MRHKKPHSWNKASTKLRPICDGLNTTRGRDCIDDWHHGLSREHGGGGDGVRNPSASPSAPLRAPPPPSEEWSLEGLRDSGARHTIFAAPPIWSTLQKWCRDRQQSVKWFRK